MKVSVLLADKGTNDPRGTLNLLNVGWAVTQLSVMTPQGLMTPAHAVVVFFELELHRCNRQLPLVIELKDADGHIVMIPGPVEPQQMRMEQAIMVAPPPGAPTGTPGRGSLLLELAPGLPLAPGSYSWDVTLDGLHNEDWSAGFYVFPPPQMQGPMFGAPSA